MDPIATLRQLLEMGWPGIVLVMLWIMWRQYILAMQANRADYDKLLMQYLDDMRRVAGLKNPPTTASD